MVLVVYENWDMKFHFHILVMGKPIITLISMFSFVSYDEIKEIWT